MKWWDRSLHKSCRVHSTRHPIGSDLHEASPNWCLSPGVALLWVEAQATKRILKCPVFHRIWSERQLHQEMARFDRVPPCISQSSNEQHSQTSITLYHPERVLIRQDASDRMMPCTMFGCPSAVLGRSVVSANNLYWEGHGKLIAFLALKRHTKEEGSEALSETDGQEGGTSGLVEYCAGRRYCPALLHRFRNVISWRWSFLCS